MDFTRGQWKEIRISLEGSSQAAEPGYSTQILIDHAYLVRNGAASNGSDLAFVYVKNGEGYSIDRFLDPSSSWNHNQTRLWFPLQAPISVGTQVKGSYYLVFGPSQFKVNEDPNRVFLMFDHFASPTLDANKWTEHYEGAGSSGLEFRDFGLHLHASSSGVQNESRSILSTWHGQLDGVLAEFMMKMPNPLSLTCNVLRPMAFESTTDHRVRHGLGLNSGSWQHLQHNHAVDELDTKPLTSMRLERDWTRYAISWRGNTQEAWMSSIRQLSESTSGDPVPTPASRDLQLRIQTAAKPGLCTGDNSSELEVDWVWVRHFALPEPLAELVN